MWTSRLLALCFAVSVSSLLAQPLVMVVESYHPENGWDREYLQGLRSKLDGVAELDYIALDTKRLPTREHLEQAELALHEIQQKKPKLVVLGDDAALALLGSHLARMKMPVVFLGVNADPKRYFSGPWPASVTGVLERPLYQQNVDLIRTVRGADCRILVLLDQDRSSFILQDDLKKLKLRGVDVVLIGTFADWQAKVKSANQQYDAILLGTYQALTAADLQHVDAEKVLQWTSEHSPVPLFGFWDFAIGRQAAAGGMVLSGFEHGAAAGKMARSLLQLPQANMPIQLSSPGHLVFSRAKVTHWQLNIPPSLQKRISWQP
ncbi:hypothetical protein K4H28_00045 [Deefgea tanakiae]|uniref:Sugar ABC transporter n=1 Tax=Deefgea tanakiae TaxID=2865840 RepID=A0ABX8Z9S7_9NEIS|nr:hypothetical protein [Deefgea tanakiae]QZA77873.1 hypothetical protein K4H28_00045 [Deefgea tanakiae]